MSRSGGCRGITGHSLGDSTFRGKMVASGGVYGARVGGGSFGTWVERVLSFAKSNVVQVLSSVSIFINNSNPKPTLQL
jgi:hypothetical protein